ncbi:DUF3540 domain-containing protein [Polaromonas sp. YR568]|uniref:DUF3540 domain-containing protein n=1 Tax=Polaromonas sp. YR568 TaxID=1855301 RepID=UPI00398C146B
MRNLAIQPKLVAIFQQYGTVTEAGEQFVVHTEAAVYRASRAASCLLEPSVGDKVLLVTDTEGADYVLAVLERAQAQGATLNLPANTEIRAASGRLNVTARDGISLQSPGEIGLQGGKLKVEALQGEVTIQDLSLVGDAWRSCVDRVKTVGKTFDSILERFHQRVSRSYRHVDELDQVKARQIDYQAETSLQLHAKYTLMTADELVKVDGGQIHLG